MIFIPYIKIAENESKILTRGAGADLLQGGCFFKEEEQKGNKWCSKCIKKSCFLFWF
jgi:hypothetical protein